jgi:hypothetical protein
VVVAPDLGEVAPGQVPVADRLHFHFHFHFHFHEEVKAHEEVGGRRVVCRTVPLVLALVVQVLSVVQVLVVVLEEEEEELLQGPVPEGAAVAVAAPGESVEGVQVVEAAQLVVAAGRIRRIRRPACRHHGSPRWEGLRCRREGVPRGRA